MKAEMKNLCLKLAGVCLGTKTKHWNEVLNLVEEKNSTCLRKTRKLCPGDIHVSVCWLFLICSCFVKSRNLMSGILPLQTWYELQNRQEIPSAILSLPSCPLFPPPVPCAPQPKWPEQMSQTRGSLKENLFYPHLLHTA